MKVEILIAAVVGIAVAPSACDDPPEPNSNVASCLGSSGFAAPTGGFKAISVGDDMACAIRHSDNKIVCWDPRPPICRGPR